MVLEEAVITAEKLTRLYSLGPLEVVGVKDIDLHVGGGEIVVLKGNSGSGKSNLLALLAALDTPTSGSLVVKGQKLQGVRADPYASSEICLQDGMIVDTVTCGL